MLESRSKAQKTRTRA